MSESNGGLDRRGFLKYGTLGLATMAALAGCSPTAGQSKSNTTTTGGKTKVTMMAVFWLPAEIKAARDIINAFNAQSKTIEVNYVQQSWGTIASKMTVAFSSGDVPDIFQYYDAGLVPWGENGLLADLTPMMSKSTMSDINPGTLRAISSPTHGLLGLPFETETPLIYYNTEMLSAAGIKPATASAPWTWDELRANAKKLTDPGRKIAGISANWSSSEILFKNGLAWQAKATPITAKNGQYSITASDPGDRKAVEYLRQLFSDGSADPTGFGGDVVASLATGKAAMLVRGSWARTVVPTTKGADKIKWAAMPFVTDATPNLGSGAAQTLSIPSAAKNKDAAAEFLAFWSKTENIAKICRASGQIPPSVSAVAALKQQVGSSNYWPDALSEAANLKGQPYCPGWLPMLGKDWDPAMFNYLKGKSDFNGFARKVATTGTADVQTAAGN